MAIPEELFESYEARVRQYGSSWFRQDAAATAVLQRDTGVRARANRLAAGRQTVGTEILYRAGDRWIDERTALHAQITQEALRSGGLNPDADRRDAIPQAVLLLGLPGSGKSSMLRPVAQELITRTADTPDIIADPDVVRTLFPEYARGLGSEVVHPETSFVTNRLLLDEAYRRRVNIIIDKVGDPDRTLAEVEYLLRSGWSVWCLCADIPTEVAVERARHRAVTEGRYVPLDLIRARGEGPLLAYEAVRQNRPDISGCALLSTDVPLGHRPVVLHAITENLFGSLGAEVAVWPEFSHNESEHTSEGRP